jgi:5'-nucleotidase
MKQPRLVIAISSRALFELDACHRIFETEGIKPYAAHQIAHENDILLPGTAFNLVKKLLAIKHPETGQALVEVILLSRNSSDTGLRIFNSIKHYGLDITRAAFTSGQNPYRYISAFSSQLFLSANPQDVRTALGKGCAAATILSTTACSATHTEVRIAFDGDAVIFSDEAELIFQQQGLKAFTESEQTAAKCPLTEGPFHGFLQALHSVQKLFPADQSPIRTALVTARSAPAHERVINTLRNWGIRIDEALFLGGLNKLDFLTAFQTDFFFDDQRHHCDKVANQVPTGHVPHGIMNETDK